MGDLQERAAGVVREVRKAGYGNMLKRIRSPAFESFW